MQQIPVYENNAAGAHFQWHTAFKAVFFGNLRIQISFSLARLLVAPSPHVLVGSFSVAAWHSPQAAILLVCSFHGNPEAEAGFGICVQKSTILVGINCTANLGILENVLRLNE